MAVYLCFSSLIQSPLIKLYVRGHHYAWILGICNRLNWAYVVISLQVDGSPASHKSFLIWTRFVLLKIFLLQKSSGFRLENI